MAEDIPSTPRTPRFAGIQNNVRSFLRDMPTPSSLYSRSPNPGSKYEGSPASTIPSFRGFRSRAREELDRPTPTTPARPTLLSSHRPEVPAYSPASQPPEWNRHPADPAPTFFPDRHPADRLQADTEEQDLEAQEPAHNGRRRKHKHKRRRRRQQQQAWVRQPGKKTHGVCFPLWHGPARIHSLTCVISGLFLAAVLAICKFLSIETSPHSFTYGLS